MLVEDAGALTTAHVTSGPLQVACEATSSTALLSPTFQGDSPEITSALRTSKRNTDPYLMTG